MNAVWVDVIDWIEEEKNCLPKIALRKRPKTADDDDDDNVATCVKKTHNNQPNCGACVSNNVKWLWH